MDEQTIKILQEQLALLLERSKKAGEDYAALDVLSHAMAKIAEAIAYGQRY